MFERFTEKAIKVMLEAQYEARKMGHSFVGTEQILLGVIREGDGVGPHVLLGFGLDLAELRRRLLENLVESYKTDVSGDSSNMHSFGSLGRLLFFWRSTQRRPIVTPRRCFCLVGSSTKRMLSYVGSI